VRAGVSEHRRVSRVRLSTAALLLLAGCASGPMSDPGFPVVSGVQAIGREWRDLATGAALRMTAKADAEVTRQGQATHVEFRTAEVLDLAASRL
jgi:hypothetical protein